MRFSSVLMAGSALALIALPIAAGAEESSNGFEAGSILVRVRAIDVIPETSSSVSSIGGSAHVSDSTVPEIDGTYFFTPNIAVEEIAGVTYHTVKDVNSVAGTVPLGSVRLLPPTLTGQWHFMPKSNFSPYVGAGINYTFFYGVKGSTSPIVYSTHYSDNVGGAFQAGFDYHIKGNWYANVDVKYLILHTDVSLGTAVGHVKASVDLNPVIAGAGIGYKF